MSDEPTTEEAEQLLNIIQNLSEKFDSLCQVRHEAGAKEYGTFTFFGNDVVRMMIEEMADTANYCRMQFIKLMLLQEMLEGKTEALKDDGGNITIGVESFRGAGKGWS